MRLQIGAVLVFSASLLQAQTPPAAPQQDWVSVTNLPSVDTNGLNPKQKTDALKSMHVDFTKKITSHLLIFEPS